MYNLPFTSEDVYYSVFVDGQNTAQVNLGVQVFYPINDLISKNAPVIATTDVLISPYYERIRNVFKSRKKRATGALVNSFILSSAGCSSLLVFPSASSTPNSLSIASPKRTMPYLKRAMTSSGSICNRTYLFIGNAESRFYRIKSGDFSHHRGSLQ